jgi:thiol-disulfide isomerase/thioredoxin
MPGTKLLQINSKKMKNLIINSRFALKKVLMLAMLVFLATGVNAQAVTLHIGDTAPPIAYSKWLKGTPVNGFNDGKVYVLEFWATWCGPCIAAMPHLSELSKKYESTATFIGVNVWENAHGGKKSYEELLAGVERFVNSSGDRMSYNVIADNKAQEMANNWLAAAGIGGIPTTFVIKNDKIVWIGHPIKLDSIMTSVVAGTFDVAAFKKQYEEKSAVNGKQMDAMKVAIKEVEDAIAKKNYTKAFQLIDTNIKKMPLLNYSLKLQKFKIYLEHFSEPEAVNYARELNKEDSSFEYIIAGTICDKDSLSKATYLFAADNYKKALETNKICLLYDALALAYSKAGDMPAAVDAEEKAVEQAKIDVKDPAMAGRVFDYTITDFQKKVTQYKSAVK